MSVDHKDDNIPYQPEDSKLFDSLEAFLKGDKPAEGVSEKNKISTDAKDFLFRQGFIFLEVGGESIDDLIKSGIPIDVLQAHRQLSPKSWDKVLPRREIAINRRYPWFPFSKGTMGQLVEEVGRYNREVFPKTVQEELIADLGIPVTIIHALLAFENRYEHPLGLDLRLATNVNYPTQYTNYNLEIEYKAQKQGYNAMEFATSGRSITDNTDRKGLILLEKRSVWESIAAA